MSIKKYTTGEVTDAGGTAETEQQIDATPQDTGTDVQESTGAGDSVESEES